MKIHGEANSQERKTDEVPLASIIVTCKGRLHHLRRTLPLMLDQVAPFPFEVVVVDYGCPQDTFRWCTELNHIRLVTMQVEDGCEEFSRSRARNCGVVSASGRVLAFVDADIQLHSGWLRTVAEPILADSLQFRTVGRFRHGWDCGGTWAVSDILFQRVRGYDETMSGWGGEDSDIYARCRIVGQEGHFSSALIRAIKHGQDDRVRYHATKAIFASAAGNAAKAQVRTAVNPDGYGLCKYKTHRGTRRMPMHLPLTPARIRSSIRNRVPCPAAEPITPLAIPSFIPLDVGARVEPARHRFGVDHLSRDRIRRPLRRHSMRNASTAGNVGRLDLLSKHAVNVDGLGAVCCYFNPLHYRSRYRTYGQFAAHVHASNVPLLTVELALGDDSFELNGYPNVMQVRARDILWHKERLLNIGVEWMLDRGFRKIAWLDADIVFRNEDWPVRIARTLDVHPACQVFRTVFRQRERAGKFQALPSSARDVSQGNPLRDSMVCPGFGWAATADTLQRASIYDCSILGNGDTLMFFASYCWPSPHEWARSVQELSSIKRLSSGLWHDYFRWACRWGAAVRGQLGFADCEIVALYHGSIVNRQYVSRDMILLNHDFDPKRDLAYGQDQCFRWSSDKLQLHDEVRAYFVNRAEDS